MPYAITQACCSDASCVAVCPVDCIHPRPDEPDFATAEMLYVDPRSCIDCGACADACPVDAVRPLDLLRGPAAAYAAINADHYDVDVPAAGWDTPQFPAALGAPVAGLRVAIVGSGPSASYTAAALLTTSAEVTMLDRLPVAGGLVRFGVAPDHLSTRRIGERFATIFRNPRLRMHLGVEVGTGPCVGSGQVSHEELLGHHDAVVYAVGAAAERRLGVPGEDLPGSLPARALVGWYNAHPEIPTDLVDLDAARSARAVVVGNGNVALDLARILLTDPADLVDTQIAGHALVELRRSRIREVVLVARRGPADAAYSLGELRALLDHPDLDVVVDCSPHDRETIDSAPPGSRAGVLQGLAVHRTGSGLPIMGRRLVLRFGSVVEDIGGRGRVESVRIAPTAGGSASVLETDLLLSSIGYRSQPVAGLPFDDRTHTVPHREGRVVDPVSGTTTPAAYVVGWVKRGPQGGIGSNRADAAETVASIVADANAGVLTVGHRPRRDFERLVRRRGAVAVEMRLRHAPTPTPGA